MRAAFLSDIHGNAIALEAVLKDIQKQRVDKLFVLGDLCFRGPDPKKALELIKGLDAPVIKGNADEWIVRGIQQGEVPDSAYDIMTKERNWAVQRLTAEDLDYLKNLPTEIKDQWTEGVTFHAFHATPNSLFKNILPDSDEETLKTNLCVEPADLYLYGHIHKAYVKYVDGKTIVNLGSVGLPFDGVTCASYAIVEAEGQRLRVSIEKVPYALDKVIEQYQESDYPNKEMMVQVIKNGKLG